MRVLIIFCALSISFDLFGATPKSVRQKMIKAEPAFVGEDYGTALKLYLEAWKEDSTNSNLGYRIGICYMNIPAHKLKADRFLAVGVQSVSGKYKEGSMKERHAPTLVYFYYAKSQHLNGKFTEAVVYYDRFLADGGVEAQLYAEEAALLKSQCGNGLILVANPVNITVENLGSTVNTPFPDYSPVISADEQTLIFTSRRPGSTGGKLDPRDNMYFEDVYIAQKTDNGWVDAKPLTQVNTDGHDANIGLSADGQQLLIYKDDAGDGNIYVCTLIGATWSAPQKLTDNVNTKGWEPSATITPDGNTMYFTSNMPGGLGGRDIYKSIKLPNGQWSKPTNLGPKINSKYDEDAPFIQADGVTLYFASNGALSMGGFDIMFSILNPDSGWSNPVNIGYPVNTPDDDVFFSPTTDNKRAYYSSSQIHGGLGEKDICILTFPDKEESKLTVLTGEITSIYGGVPEGIVITVTDVETGEIVGVYTPNSQTGKYVIILTPGGNYNIRYEAVDYLYQSDNLNIDDSTAYQTISRTIELEPIKVGQKLVVRNIFFDSGKSELKPESKLELDKLVNLLQKFPELIVEISGHTNAAGNKEFNQKLSEKRAQSVALYLIDKGIAANRLRTIGYGDERPIAKNYNENGSRNHQGMAMNSRFELKVLSIDGKLKDVVEPILVPEPLHLPKK
jgi:outer membrane protein OmpA-like peptidoglycan-associated protein